METKIGPSYANLFVGYVENIIVPNCHRPKLYLYKRYIDDCVSTTLSTALKCPWEISVNSLAFLNIKL